MNAKRCHKGHAVTGALSIAAACRLPGSVAHDLATRSLTSLVHLEHPSGRTEIDLSFDASGHVSRASLVRTARRISRATSSSRQALSLRLWKGYNKEETMPKTITRRLLSCALLAASTALATPFGGASAQDSFPVRPMKLVVPYAAGGGTDAIARLVAQGVGEKLGQSLIVENNGSAGGNVATQQAAKAEPDGYTVLMANQGPMVVNPHLFKNVKIDPLTAFDPITLITAAPLVVVVPKNSEHKTIKELIEHAQKNPGKLTYGSAGNGSASHLATVLLAQVTNFQATHVPYRGAGPALNDLLGGRMDFMVTTVRPFSVSSRVVT